jgi:outer membrane protein assembly factor BamA
MTRRNLKNTPSLNPSALVSILVIIIASTTAVAQQAGRRIARIEVVGLQRLSQAEVIAATGLNPGDPFSVAALDAAGQKLVDSGLFAKVAYRTRTQGNQMTIVFEVEEVKGGQSPVSFDNFVWFTDGELIAAIRRELPSFIGTAPDAGNTTDKIKLALQNLLNEKQIKGTVEYSPWQASATSLKQEHLFSVSGVPIPICTLQFPGASHISEVKLVIASRQLTDADYSQKSALAFGTFILLPLYREEGLWRAKFADPITQLESSGSCKGVNLTLPVDEGPVYLWSKPEWTGNKVLSPAELESALGLKDGDVAKSSSVDKALIEVSKAYGRIGYIDARTQAQPKFDDQGKRIAFKIDIKEGPRYTMGSLFIKGLPETDTRALEEVWKLRRSEVFNSEYLDQFFRIDGQNVIRRIVVTRLEQGKSQPQIETDIKRNPLSLTADVVLEFKE